VLSSARPPRAGRGWIGRGWGSVLCVAWLMLSLRMAHAEQRYALVIGANPGWSQDRPLRYAETDAERMRDVLVDLGGFPRGHVAVLRDPDTREVRGALDSLTRVVRGAGEDTLVFVYYSGHADARHVHLRGEPPLSHDELQAALRALPATITLAVIDACKSGTVTRKGGQPTTEFDVDVVAPKLSGLVVLTSSGADELSQESRALAGSVFTHHLISALRGAADNDADQRVTLGEAYRYAYDRTRADTAGSGAPQAPAFRYELSGQGELVLTHLATGREAQLLVPRGPPQQYVVLDAHELRLIAELRSEPKRDHVIALAPGTYRVKRVLRDRLEVASVVVAAGMSSNIEQVAFHRVPLSSGILKGESRELSPAERHEWELARALGALSDGQVVAALNLFDRLLRETPGDVRAWRGRGRALVRMADSYRRVNDTRAEQRALTEALKSDPSLANDPEFQVRYAAGAKLAEADRAEADARHARAMELSARPRADRRFGLGLELLSVRSLLGVSGTVRLLDRISSSVALDFPALGLDASVVIQPLLSRWSPYLGFGAHASLRDVGVDIDPLGMSNPTTTMGPQPTKVWGASLRVEIGAQYVNPTGFTTELGLAVVGFRWRGDVTALPFPVFHLGWIF